MFRVLEVILLGGGSIGALSGWLLCRWLDARTAAVRRRVVGVAKHDAAAGAVVSIEMTPGERERILPKPGGLPPPAYPGHCNYARGEHRCARIVGHVGEHMCNTCAAIPPHRFS